jgi:8-amino-7-oxononanoate synthase
MKNETDKFGYLARELEQLASSNLLREPICIDSAQGTTALVAGAEKVVFCSNNYLGLANHPAVVSAVSNTIGQYGHGAAASRLINGTMQPHIELEGELAKLFAKEAALVLPSGWMANEAVIRTIPQKDDLILIDKIDHASIIDAAKSSGIEFRTYRREDLSRLEKLLSREQWKRKFIVTESIFSMDGDSADLAALVELKNKYDAYLILDEAHAMGCFGTRGAGLAEQLGLLDEIDIVVATLSKAAGSGGGAVAAEKVVIDMLINRARSFIYTTACTVSNCAAAMASVRLFRSEPQRRQRLRDNSEYLRGKLRKMGIDTGRSCSQIIPVIIGSDAQALAVSRGLFDRGFLVPAIRPPTVAVGTARLRVSVQSEHTKDQMDGFCKALAEVFSRNSSD